MPRIDFATSALPPSAAIVKAVRQINLAPSGKVSNSFSAALIHETGRVVRVMAVFPGILNSLCMLSYLTTLVKKLSADKSVRPTGSKTLCRGETEKQVARLRWIIQKANDPATLGMTNWL